MCVITECEGNPVKAILTGTFDADHDTALLEWKLAQLIETEVVRDLRGSLRLCAMEERAADSQADVLIIDVTNPERIPWLLGTLREFCKPAACKEVVVLLPTGNIELIQQFVRAGVGEVLVKPVSVSMLEAMLRLHLPDLDSWK